MNSAEREITIGMPETSTAATVAVKPGYTYSLGFDPGAVESDVEGPSLVFRFDNGSSLVLQDFFIVAAQDDFYLRLADGALLSGKDVADSFLLNLQDFACGAGGLLEADDGLAPYLGENSSEHAAEIAGGSDFKLSALPAAEEGARLVGGMPQPGAGAGVCAVPEVSPSPDESASTEQYLRSLLML